MNVKHWPQPTPQVLAKIKKKAKWSGDCLLWNDNSSRGYGRIKWKSRRWMIHRLALVWHDGGVEKTDLFVLHRCRNRNCFNVEHLRWGTAKENAKDREEDGKTCFGSRSKQAKLNDDKIIQICKMFHEEGRSSTDIGKNFGVGPGIVMQIVNGETWKKAPRPGGLARMRPMVPGGRWAKYRSCSSEQVLSVWRMWHEEYRSLKEIKETLNMKNSIVTKILHRAIYKDITCNLEGPRSRPMKRNKKDIPDLKPSAKIAPGKRFRLEDDEIRDIWSLFHNHGLQQFVIAEKYNISRQTVRHITRGLTSSHLTKTLVCERKKMCKICQDKPEQIR